MVNITDIEGTIDVYVKKNYESDPNKFDYDLKFMGVKSSLKINAEILTEDGIAVSIYAAGIATKMNALLETKFNIGVYWGYQNTRKEDALFI